MLTERVLSVALSITWLAGAGPAHGQDTRQLPENASCPGADLFTNGAITRIDIEIARADLASLNNDSRLFVPATVSDSKGVYQRVAVHLKGSVGSFRPLSDKPGLTLDFAKLQSRQRFHGLRRIHLNNSVEDPSYCNEALGSDLFRAAGIPAPRVSRAVVTLNGRRLGLYVLKEGFMEDFLSCYFTKLGGNLYEPGEGHDVNQRLKRAAIQAPVRNRSALKALSEAALEPDAQRRWQRLDQTLELERFIRFMAMEVMICHRDGYCLARNNFRVYQNFDSGKMVFFPHGMDQLFGSADLPWMPNMAGLVARAVLETPEGKQRYQREFRALFETLFKPQLLSRQVDQLLDGLSSVAQHAELASLRSEGDAVKERIYARYHELEQQLKAAEVAPLNFVNGVAELSNWAKVDPPAIGRMDRVTGPDGSICLHILASSECSASWRTRVLLPAGRYRFGGKARVSALKPLSFGTHQGAGLRISGQSRQSPDVSEPTPDWHLLSERFEVGPSGGEVECICELRAGSGEAWFECASLRLLQEP